MTVSAVKARKARPKLADIRLDRDIYREACAAMGFDPLAREVIDWNIHVEDSPLQVESARALFALPELAS